jgi:hypothetical protein
MNVMLTQTTLQDESLSLLNDIFGDDIIAESVCIQDLIEWSGNTSSPLSKHQLSQLIVYSEDKLRELFDIYCDVVE